MYFPKLYPDELLYSAIARLRVHLGILSQRELLRQLFSDPTAVATTDLPTHLAHLSREISSSYPVDATQLVYQHTLFPLYAPFISEERKKRLYEAMVSGHNVSKHGVAGLTTAKVKTPGWLRYCPRCLEEMIDHYGEFYWHRVWQVTGVDACTVHNCQLATSRIPFRSESRHEFVSASPANCPTINTPRVSCWGACISELAYQLLNHPAGCSPSYWQWSHFYHCLAQERGATHGHHLRLELLWKTFLLAREHEWLESSGLCRGEEIPLWFAAIFRKHRKSFSYLQHLVVWACFRPERTVTSLIEEALSYPDHALVSIEKRVKKGGSYPVLLAKRTAWETVLSDYGVKGVKYVRQRNEALYAWLYRNDRGWLIEANEQYHLEKHNHAHTDWAQRDRRLIRVLIRTEKVAAEDLSCSRRSRQWFIRQLPHSASIQCHLDSLPLCRAFLIRYAESTAEYQIRRFTRMLIEDQKAGGNRKRWELERAAGLSSRRMTSLTEQFLQGVYREVNEEGPHQ